MYRAKGLPTATIVLSQLKHRYIWLARLGWGVVTLLSLIVFVASMQLAFTTELFARMPELAAELDVALFSIFANNHLLASNSVLLATAGQFLAFSGIGLFLFWRKSHDYLAILASAMLISIGAGMSPAVFFLPILRPAWHLPASLLQALLFSALILFLYLLPNGRFVPSWTRPASLLWGLYAISWLIWPQLNPHRAGNFVALLIFVAWAWTGVVAQIYRHRQTAGIERQQQKWIMIGGFATHLLFGLLVVSSAIGLNQRMMAVAPLPIKLLNTLLGFSVFLIPISIVIAVLRYRLWEINIWINRTMVYGGLTAIIIALYGLTVGLMSAIFQAENSLFVSVLVTGLVAILISPLRQRLQAAVNRLMYGERDDPSTVLASLGKRLEETAAPAQILPKLVETIAHSLRLPYVAIAVRRPNSSEIVAAYPEVAGERGAETFGGPAARPAERVVTLPLTYQSEPIGQLLAATRSPNESFNLAEMRLLRDIARQAGLAVHTYLLTVDLQRSRKQLVTTREEERRRLRRDLHDGLGPGLATVSVKVSAAQNLLDTDPKGTARLLAEVQVESLNAVREIRRVVDGLRPAALDQLGLLSAVREFVAQNENGQTQLAFQGPETLPPLPAAVEVAAYRIMTEAVTNVLRHADAETCRISLSVDDHLQLEIRDDGRGLPDPLAPGVGLSSMRERAEELGGQFAISSTRGMGTVLLVALPLTSHG